MSEQLDQKTLEEKLAAVVGGQSRKVSMAAISMVAAKLGLFCGVNKLDFVMAMASAYDLAVALRKPLN